MRLELRDDLPFVIVEVSYQGRTLAIPSILVDTGSATSILSADQVAAIEIQPAPEDRLYTIRGVGGNEVVFAKQVDYLQAGEKRMAGFEIEVGGMEYGFEMNGILGMNFLIAAGAVIDLEKSEIRFSE